MNLIEKLNELCEEGNIKIPKPESENDFFIKGWGKRRGEKALIYRIPSHKEKPFYEKGITVSEFVSAFENLQKTGVFTKKWFAENLPKCKDEGDCNFTTIGGIFELLKIAKYSEDEKGLYIKL